MPLTTDNDWDEGMELSNEGMPSDFWVGFILGLLAVVLVGAMTLIVWAQT